MSNENANLTKVIVPCRFSYLHCWEPNAVSDGDPKYSVSAIIPKSDTETIEKIKRAIEQAKKDSVSKWGGKVPANLKLPLRDGDIDRPEDEAYADSYFFNANSKQAPQVVDKNVQPILDQSEVYSGNKGIAAGLGNIQKLRDGESLGGRTNAEDDFDAVEVDDEEDFLG